MLLAYSRAEKGSSSYVHDKHESKKRMGGCISKFMLEPHSGSLGDSPSIYQEIKLGTRVYRLPWVLWSQQEG